MLKTSFKINIQGFVSWLKKGSKVCKMTAADDSKDLVNLQTLVGVPTKLKRILWHGLFWVNFSWYWKTGKFNNKFSTRQTFYSPVTENVQIIGVGMSNFAGNFHAHRHGQINLEHIQAENFFAIANIWVIFPNHENKKLCCSHCKRAFVPVIFQERLAGSHEFFCSDFPQGVLDVFSLIAVGAGRVSRKSVVAV